MKKKISLATIIFSVLCALICILALFGAVKFEGVTLSILFSCLVLTVAGILSLNSLAIMPKAKNLAIANFSLIGACSFLVILAQWTDLADSDIYVSITITLSILSVCFNFITADILKLSRNYLWAQIPTYICFGVTSIFLIAACWGSSILDDYLKIFVLFIILSILGIGVLAVLSKKTTESDIKEDFIKISKFEYNELIEIKEKYQKLLGEKND